MRGWILIVGVFGGIAALCWYGATGETGPLGWLNSWQNANTGSYSRGLSFLILCVAVCVIGAPVLGAWSWAARKSSARSGEPSAPFTAPADAKIAAMSVAMNDRSRWRGRMYLAIWLWGLALVWAVVLGWHGWDFHRRATDAGGDYTPLRLDRTATAVHAGDGSHWALQGRLLWDRGATQTTKYRGRQTETVYVPLAPADWRPGDAVQFVVRLPKSDVWALQQRNDGADAPLLVRVEGAIPTPSRAVFRRIDAPPVDAAVLVDVITSSGGQVRDAYPTFDWENAKLIGLALSATWTAGLWLGALGVLVKVRRQRRQKATRPA